MLNPNVEVFLGCDCPLEQARTVLFGAPFDSTTSYRPGTRFGSSAIRHESFGVETYSPYQDKDLADACVLDTGDLELCFGSAEQALSDIEAHTHAILEAGKRPFLRWRRTPCHTGSIPRSCPKISRCAHHSF